ncbi:hypothetical protein D918_01144 [Trichuris suis]|nr:hypothetical protein D918_01144 [Trichuris suis]
MTAHLVLVICVFWSKFIPCFTTFVQSWQVLGHEHTCQLAIGFHEKRIQNERPTILHAAGTVTLSIFILKLWSSYLYWYIFGFCSAFPAVCELSLITQMMKTQAFSQVVISN